MIRLRFAALVLLLAAVMSAGPGNTVYGQGDGTLRAPIPEEAAGYKGWMVSSLRIEGLPGELADPLRKGLVLSGESKFLGTRRATFYVPELRKDLDRARLFLARHGYPDAIVEPRFVPSRKDRKVKVFLQVDPGEPILVDRVEVLGFPRGTATLRAVADRMVPGTVFTDSRANAIAGALQSGLKERGFAFAVVTPLVTATGPHRVQIAFTAQPGRAYIFGEIEVTGAASDLKPLVRKTVDVEPGGAYAPSALERADQNLRLLDLFRRIRVGTRRAGGDTLTVEVELISREPRVIETGIGYWTDDFIRGSSRWKHRNLFEGGRGLEARASYSRFRQEGGLSTWWPALFGARHRLQLSGRIRQDVEESYDQLTIEAELSNLYRHSLHTSLRAAAALSNVNVVEKTDDPNSFVESNGRVTVFSLVFNRDASDSRLYPTRGTTQWARMEWGPPGFISDSHYLLGEVALVGYTSLFRLGTLALRVDGGLARPLGSSVDLLPDRRFYAGGAGSMRGYRRRRLGPLDSDGGPIGGEAKFEGSAEVRIPLVGRFSLAGFFDAGQVWSTRDEAALGTVEFAAGPGLIVRTPVGPVRADLGFRIGGRESGQPVRVFHLTIGNPF